MHPAFSIFAKREQIFMPPKKVIGLGEVLWDIFPERKIFGGAPANFAYYASQFGLEGCVVSAVGNDSLGKEILKFLAEKKLKSLISTVKYPTGTVKVTLNAKGIPQYDIRENSAWDNIPFTKRAEKLARDCSAVCFGTLAQRSETSRATLYRFLELVPEDALKIFDINLRQNFYSKDIILRSLQHCNVLKMNNEEIAEMAQLFGLPNMTEQEVCSYLLRTFHLKIVADTRGAAGSYVFTPNETSYLSSPKISVKNTVGAGDSWIGAFVAALLNGESLRSAHELAVKTATRRLTEPNF